MEGSLWVAVAGIGLAALTTGLTYLSSEKRRKSEDRRHSERLNHELRLTLWRDAAHAYRLCSEIQGLLTWAYIESLSLYPDIEADVDDVRVPPAVKRRIMDGVNVITEAKAYAWTDDMITACGAVIVAIANLENIAFASIGALRANRSGGDRTTPIVQERFERIWSEYDEAIETYRRSIRILGSES